MRLRRLFNRRKYRVLEREALIREGIVLGFACGANWGRHWNGEIEGVYPKDSRVVERVLHDAVSFNDIYPNLAAYEPSTSWLGANHYKQGGDRG